MECELCSRLPTLQVNMGIALEIDCAKTTKPQRGPFKNAGISEQKKKIEQSAEAGASRQSNRNFIEENIRSIHLSKKQGKISIAIDTKESDSSADIETIIKKRTEISKAKKEKPKKVPPSRQSKNFIEENVQNIAILARKIAKTKQEKSLLYPPYLKPSRSAKKKKLKISSKETQEDPLNVIMKLGRERDKRELQRGQILSDLKKEISITGGLDRISVFVPANKKKKKTATKNK